MMPSRVRRGLLAGVLAVSLSASAMARPAAMMGFDPDMVHQDPNGARYLSVRDSNGIFDAMERGDEPALQAIRSRLGDAPSGGSPVTRAYMFGLCDMAIARVHGDYDGADAILDRCRRASGCSAIPTGPSIRSIS